MKKIRIITSTVLVLILMASLSSLTFAEGSYTIEPVKSVFNYGAEVNFNYTGAVNTTDWIGIYEPGVKPGDRQSIIWIYVGNPDSPDGTTDFVANGQASDISAIAYLPKGKYDAYLCLNDGYEVAASTQFEVLYDKDEVIPEDTTSENPDTGDAGLVLSLVVLALSAAGIFVFRK